MLGSIELPEPHWLESAYRSFNEVEISRRLTYFGRAIGRRATAEAGAEGVLPGLGRVSIVGTSYFQLDPAGSEAFIMPVRRRGVPIDLIAWRPNNPREWFWYCGTATILNLDAATLPNWDLNPVVVHDTPLSWLRADRKGCVILDWSSPDIGWLTCMPAIECEPFISAKIKRAILQMRLPRFVAPKVDHGRAA